MKRLLPFLLFLLSSATLADSGAYRVEVIIFRNLDAMAEAVVAEELRSFSQFPGLEKPEPPKLFTEIPIGESPEESIVEPLEKPPGEAPDDLPEPVRYDLPDDLSVLIQKGTSMDGVWRRLRSSQGYRPLVYAAWQQNRTDYYPPIRVHNQQVIDTQLRPPTHVMVADLAAQDPLAAYRSTFYQLDGSVQLRRSRFLHLYLDLEHREESAGEATEAGLLHGPDILTGAENESTISQTYDIFNLKENRQIRTGRLQYFDTPYFGALVLVSAMKTN